MQRTEPTPELRRVLLALLQAAAPLLAGTAQAQTVACEQLKSTLAARIEATGVRSYSLEAVPADTATPSDARVIGTCSIGAYKVLYRRWGSTQKEEKAPAAAASAAGRESPRAEAPVPAAEPQPAARAEAVPAVPVPAAPSAVPPAAPTPTPAAAFVGPQPQEPQPTAPALRGPPAPEEPPRPDVPMPPTPQPGLRATAPQGPASSVVAAAASPARRAFAFELTTAQWAGAVGLLLLAGVMTAWLAHRSAYDRAGLPRGPRVRIRG